MIDNITIVQEIKQPIANLNAQYEPFVWNGLLYTPIYKNGAVQKFESQLGNLRLRLHPFSNKLSLSNSIHTFWNGYNYDDFSLSTMKTSIDSISDTTNIDWRSAVLKKLEYGCTINANAFQIYSNLESYKDKPFQPMYVSNGKEYGRCCGFEDYRIKGYDKTFQINQTRGIKLNTALFRWEIAVSRMRNIERLFNSSPIIVSDVLIEKNWKILADDALKRYRNALKTKIILWHKISNPHYKRVMAAMMNDQIRKDLKFHHKKTYLRDRAIYRRILEDNSLSYEDEAIVLLERKFEELRCK